MRAFAGLATLLVTLALHAGPEGSYADATALFDDGFRWGSVAAESPHPLVVHAEALAAQFSFAIDGRMYRPHQVERSFPRADDMAVRFVVPGEDRISTLTRSGTMVAGDILTPDGDFYLRPSRAGHILHRLGHAVFPCETLEVPLTTASESRGRRRAVRKTRPDWIAEHRLLFTYTRRFAEKFGSDDAAHLVLGNALDALNTGLRETGDAKTVAVFVDAWRLDDTYMEVAGHRDAIDRLRDDTILQSERFRLKAAIVMHFDLITGGGGVAYALDDPSSPGRENGLAVIDFHDVVSIPHTVQHEYGHVFGLHHDVPHASPRACPYCYAFGNCAAGLKDRMGSVPCFAREVHGYSSLSRRVNGIVLGSAESDGLRRILENRFVVADLWRYAIND